MALLYAGGVVIEALNYQVLRGFNLKPGNVLKQKGNFIVNAHGKRSMLQKTDENINHILFSHDIKNFLKENNFKNVDHFSLSINNTPYYTYNNENYIMTEAPEAEQMDFSKVELFLRLVSDTALMHKILKEMRFSGEAFKGGNMLKRLSDSKNQLSKIKRQIGNSGRMSDFDVVFLKTYEEYMEKISLALDILRTENYMQESGNKSICHNILKKENIYVKNGEIFFSNFSKASFDYCIFDLSSLIKRYLKHNTEKRIDIYQIVDTYAKVNPIGDEEINILYAFLLYPEGFVNVCESFYYKKRSFIPSSMERKLILETEGRRKYEEYINRLIAV